MNETKPQAFQQLRDCIKTPRKVKKAVRAFRTLTEAWKAASK